MCIPLLWPVLVMAGLQAGCAGERDGVNGFDGEAVYATVNGKDLTESGLRALVPGGFYDRLTAEHKQNIAEDWIQSELLYQEALRAGIDREPDIRFLLSQSERQLLSNELLERQLSSIPRPSESALREFYESNQDLFRLETNEYNVRYALFDTKGDVNTFHSKVKQNANFSDLARESSKDPSSQDGGSIGVVNEDMVEPSVWEAVIATRTKYGLHKISDPFTVIDGWACIIIDDMYEAGSVKPFELVQDLVYDMYTAEQREAAREELISRLAADAKIERHMEAQSE
jgi:peptidyl-prolyl cis-trans isomerase C